MAYTAEQAYAELIRREKERTLLGTCGSLLGWDERTYMPSRGAPLRADQIALLARMTHEMLTTPKVGDMLTQIEGTGLVRDPLSAEAVNVRELRRNYNRAVKIPKTLVEELARA